MQSAGSLGRFLGPILAFALVSRDTLSDYGRTSFFASAAILVVAMICILGVVPVAHSAPVPDAIPES
jgi:hypothetical protein